MHVDVFQYEKITLLKISQTLSKITRAYTVENVLRKKAFDII